MKIALLGYGKMGKIVEKLAGTDFTAKEKADYILKYMETTKHQSPTRRILAILFMSEQIMLVTVCTFAASRGFV